MDMSQAGLIADLKSMLMDSVERFTDPDHERQLDTAAADLSRVAPRVVSAELTLTAGESFYDGPADLLKILFFDWGMNDLRTTRPWETTWPGALPCANVLEVSGARKIWVVPSPSTLQINRLGATAPYRYSATYTVDANAANTTVPESRRHLLLLRALAEAMQDLAGRGVSKPVTLGPKAGVPIPSNGAPSALAHDLLTRFERQAASV